MARFRLQELAMDAEGRTVQDPPGREQGNLTTIGRNQAVPDFDLRCRLQAGSVLTRRRRDQC
jgi:hypothetical protein